MVEFDIYNYLVADVTLGNLLGATASDSKIYPQRAPQGASYPYIVYNVDGYGDTEEYLHTDRMTFKIAANSYGIARSIRDRIRLILDMEKYGSKVSITSANYRIEYTRLVSGIDMEDREITNENEETGVTIMVQIYEIKFLDR